MKVFKVFLITSMAVLLSGCYTQLQYSQKMKKITDEEEKVYSWDDEEEREQVEEPTEKQKKDGYDEDYVPLYYKDYEYEERYKDCACNPHNVYNFYGSDWYGYDPYYSFGTYLSLSPSFFYRAHHPYYYGYRYHPRFSISFSWGWGRPYYGHFYDPFFDPFYDYYWYGYRPYAYGHRYFYGNYGYYYDKKDRINRNSRYGPRSIGTNRVVTNGNRSRDVNTVTGRSGTTVTTKSKVRTRSVGTTRTRSTTDRNSGSTVRTRGKSSGSDGGTTRSRSRDNLQSNNDRYPIYIDRTDEPQRPVIINRDRLEQVRSRTRNENSGISEEYLQNRLQNSGLNNQTVRSRATFFERMKNFFEDNSSRIMNADRIRTNNRTLRSRSTSSSSSRSTISSGKSKSRSSVTRSRSSSSNSRSRGSTSRSRSSSSGSDRSRDN